MFTRIFENDCDNHGCGSTSATVHDNAYRGKEWVIAICDWCDEERWTPILHFAPRLRTTLCGREVNGEHRMITQIATEVDCVECRFLLGLVNEEGLAPTPDWRPPFPIAEDEYAVE
jgi:hypothetical protein